MMISCTRCVFTTCTRWTIMLVSVDRATKRRKSMVNTKVLYQKYFGPVKAGSRQTDLLHLDKINTYRQPIAAHALTGTAPRNAAPLNRVAPGTVKRVHTIYIRVCTPIYMQAGMQQVATASILGKQVQGGTRSRGYRNHTGPGTKCYQFAKR